MASATTASRVFFLGKQPRMGGHEGIQQLP